MIPPYSGFVQYFRAMADSRPTISLIGQRGTTAPVAALQINGGQAVGTYYAANSTTINWNQGNVQSTNVGTKRRCASRFP